MSTKDFGCFFCLEKSTDASGTCPGCGRPINVGPALLSSTIGEYKPSEILGRGFSGWTLKVADSYQSFAMKVVPAIRLRNEPLADGEVKKLIACGHHRHIASFIRLVNPALDIHGQSIEVSCMVFEYIENAVPLRAVMGGEGGPLTKTDVVAILAGIASGLERMHSNHLWHEDLHDDNILIRTVQQDENLSDRFEAKLIDFGSANTVGAGQSEQPGRSDYAYLAKHMYGLAACLEVGNAGSLTPPDRTFVSRLRDLGHRISDQNVSRRSMAPTGIRLELRAILDRCAAGQNFPSFQEMKKESRVSFSEPLENTNALFLAPQDIALLFQDSLGWRDWIAHSSTVLVVGPRGCGKTMFLRYLSIASCARPRQSEEKPEDVGRRLAEMRHVGFLINVGQLRTPFLRSAYKRLETADPARAEDFSREFFNCHFVFEVLRTLIWLVEERIAILSKDDVNVISAVVDSFLHERGGAGPPPTLQSLAETLDRRVMTLSNLSDPESYSPSNLASDAVLQSIATAIRRTVWGSSKEVWLKDPRFRGHAISPAMFRTEVRDVKESKAVQFRVQIGSCTVVQPEIGSG